MDTYQTLTQRYENGCLMIMDHRDDAYHFLGTAFIVHPQGYLLTAAHLLESATNPVAVNAAQPGQFSPLTPADSATYPVTIAQIDTGRDLALLKMQIESEIGAPDDFVGNPEGVGEGAHLLVMGIPFGHFRIHKVMVMQAMLSAKIISPNETQLLVFDTRIHPGDVGGPLINVETGRVVGIIQGAFNPLHIQQVDEPEGYEAYSNFSYALSFSYAHPLLEAEGLSERAGTPP